MRSTSTSSVSAPSRPQYIVGTPAKKVTFSVLEDLHGLRRVEPGEQDERRAHREAGVHLHRGAERVEERQRDQVHVVLGDAELPVARERVQQQVGVRELGALGPARRAARVEDDGRVGRLGDDGLERRGLPGHGRVQGLGALDGGCGSGRRGDQEEGLAARGLVEAGPALRTHRQLRAALEADVRLRVASPARW